MAGKFWILTLSDESGRQIEATNTATELGCSQEGYQNVTMPSPPTAHGLVTIQDYHLWRRRRRPSTGTLPFHLTFPLFHASCT